MTAAKTTAPATDTGRYAGLTVVRDGAGYVLGSTHSPDFVAVPEIGGHVVRWLQDSRSIDECARQAAQSVGEPVDVAGFIDGLVRAGLLPAADAETTPERSGSAEVAVWKSNLGRCLFGPVGLAGQGLLTLTGVVVMLAVPRLHPTYTDAIVTSLPLASLLIVAVVGTALGLLHECAHVLAAWAAGVSSRVSISRRMVTVVFQTDLTRLWSVPRRARLVPLLAGMSLDGATVGLLTILELTASGTWPPLIGQLVRTVVFLNLSAILLQFLIFMRTDVYALFVVVTGCKNLWATKGALVRKTIRRASAEDLAMLAALGRREIFWARIFLCLYGPGVVWTTWYFVTFAVPAVAKIVAMSLDAVLSHGLASPAGAAGAAAFLLTTATTSFVLRGLLRTLVRLGRQLATKRALRS